MERSSGIERLYLIDDSDEDAYLTKRVLLRQGVELQTCSFLSSDAFMQFVEASAEFNVVSSIVVVDFYLRPDRGPEVVTELLDRYPQLLVGIGTGSESPRNQAEAMAAGAKFFISKPINVGSIRRICAQVERVEMTQNDGVLKLTQYWPTE